MPALPGSSGVGRAEESLAARIKRVQTWVVLNEVRFQPNRGVLVLRRKIKVSAIPAAKPPMCAM